LQGRGIHAVSLAFWDITAIIVLFSLFLDGSFQKLEIFRISIIFFALGKESTGIIDDFLKTLCLRNILFMINYSIAVIWICVVLKAFEKFDLSIPM